MRIRHALLGIAALGLAGGYAVQAAPPLDDMDMGLSKGSVFDAPAPPTWDYVATQGPIPRYFADAPPMVPHAVGAYQNITAAQNLCMGCHKLPDKIGQQVAAGMATPMPASHYTDLRNAPAEVTKEIDGSRYNCTLCHQAQADAKPLVENTFKP